MQEKWEDEADVSVDTHNQQLDKLADQSYSCQDNRLTWAKEGIDMILKHEAEHYIVFSGVKTIHVGLEQVSNAVDRNEMVEMVSISVSSE